MKKILLSILMFGCLGITAQTDTTKKISAYASIGLSLTNTVDTTFKTLNYPSVEVGVMVDNICLGFVFGRSSLLGIGAKTDNINNYFYELKTTLCQPIAYSISGVFILGYGGYMNSKTNFIEYGAGISYSHKKIGYNLTYSNWDKINYITPSITINF